MAIKPPPANLYLQVITITDDYLGPASERFVTRQIRNHLHKEPDNLSDKDLPQLINWIQITISVLTDDSHIITEYVHELKALARAHTRND